MQTDVTTPREDMAKIHSRNIKAQIIKLLQENPEGLNFNKIFYLMKTLGVLNNYSLLSSNLKELMRLGLVERKEIPGPGIARKIYRLVDTETRGIKRKAIPEITAEILGPLPCLSYATDHRGEIVRVHVEKGRKEEFLKAVKAINAVAEYCQPIIRSLSNAEKGFFFEWLENTRLLFMLPSTILREGDPARSDAAWRIYLTLVMSRFEELFDDFASNVPSSKTKREKWNKNLRNFREKFFEIAQATMTKRINLDKVTIHEVSPLDVNAKKLMKEVKAKL